MIDVAETARTALEILEEHGWCRGSVNYRCWIGSGPRYPVGSHCIGGAWNLAASGTVQFQPEDSGIYDALAGVIQAQYPECALRDFPHCNPQICTIMWFNDTRAGSESDVRRILEKLAAG